MFTKLVLFVVVVAAVRWAYLKFVAAPPPAATPSLPPPPVEAEPKISPMDVQISPEDIFERFEKGQTVVFVDVRETPELAGGIVDGAKHIPSGDIEVRFTELQPSDEIVLYCASGGRSTRAALFMRDKGYDKVWSLVGGFSHWQRDGGKTTMPT